jgi:hypothetical protein
MKLSLITAVALGALAAGCGTSEEEKKADPPKQEEPAPPSESTPQRQLVDGKTLSTSPVNLLADPGFSLVGRSSGGLGSYIAIYDGSSREADLTASLDSRSPASFGGAVAIVRAENATDSKSKAITLLTSFLGGKGPFHARIWVSKSNVAGGPVDLPTDGSAVTVSVMDGSPDSNDAYDLAVDPDVTKTIAGRTWVLLRGDVSKPLDNGGFFVVHTGTTGGQIHLAAPEVTSDEVVIGQAVKSRSSLRAATVRTKVLAERAAIKRYYAIPPRLVPAAPKPALID